MLGRALMDVRRLSSATKVPVLMDTSAASTLQAPVLEVVKQDPLQEVVKQACMLEAIKQDYEVSAEGLQQDQQLLILEAELLSVEQGIAVLESTEQSLTQDGLKEVALAEGEPTCDSVGSDQEDLGSSVGDGKGGGAPTAARPLPK